MKRALRLSMVGLVLANLGFVQITDGASWTWLGPLVALTVASPWLTRLQKSGIYRLLWNGAVVGVFLLLVRHALQRGLGNLLEDGLLLAALCQVHLLNNIDAQKPDLLFFNSFLIAVVTSFLGFGVGYSLAFLAYAPLLVVSMQLLVLAQSGAEPPVGRVLRDGLLRSGVAVALTLAVFLLAPRDFHRKGLLGERFRFRPPERLLDVDFTDEVALDRSGRAALSDRVVLRARLLRGAVADVPAHWRGATLDVFDGNEWKPARGGRPPEGPWWRPTGDRRWERGAGPEGACLDVEMPGRDSPHLFVPLEAAEVRFDPPLAAQDLVPLSDATFRVARPSLARSGFRFSVVLRDGPLPLEGAASPRRTVWQRVDADDLPAAARSLARAIRGRLPEDAPQSRIVEEIRRNLSTTHAYIPPGEEGGARNLAEFFEGGAGGHCEIFASALAVALRSLRIPCRLATGFRSEEWDPETQTLTFRARHAHAWVEVLDPERGWVVADATPASEGAGARARSGLLDRFRGAAWSAWERLLSFNDGARSRLFGLLRRLPAWAFLAVASPFALLLVRRLRRRPEHPAVRRYRRRLASLGIRPRPGETPREILRRADLPERTREWLAESTAVHERARYRA